VLAYATWCIVIAATIADLGIGTVLQRFVPNLRAAGEHDEPGRMSSPVNKAGRVVHHALRPHVTIAAATPALRVASRPALPSNGQQVAMRARQW
jgi:hypothetical protein